MKRRTVLRAAVVAASLLAMTTITGVGASAAVKTAASPTGTPLLIGWLGSQTSAAAPARTTATSDTLDAWVKYTNAQGGVAGHPVKAVYEPDDKADPAVAIADIKDLTESKKVLAVVGDTSGSEQAWADYAEQQKIPIIGPNNIDTLPITNSMFYAVGGGVISNLWGQMKSAAVQGVKKVGVLLCTENPACGQARPLFKSMATANGMTETYDAVASATQPSYTAECLAAKEAGVEAFAAYVNDPVLARDCARQSFTPKWINADGGPGRTQIKAQPSLGKAVGSSEQWTCQGPSTPKTASFYTAMKKYHPEYNAGTNKFIQSGPGDCKAWAAGEAFKKAIENANVAPTATATRDDVIRGLSMFSNETLGGFAPGLTYSDGTKPNPQIKCIYLYKWNNLDFIRVPKNLTPTCQP
jgi:branched-chain amino acid transport system substrate-binding protein